MILIVNMSGCFLKPQETITRVSITPVPEEVKGNMWIASEKPIQVKSQGIQLIATNNILGQIQGDIQVSYLDKRTNTVKTINAKGCLLTASQSLDNKGYSEVMIEGTPVQVGVEGTDVITYKNVAGYYLVHKDDLKVLINGLNKSIQKCEVPDSHVSDPELEDCIKGKTNDSGPTKYGPMIERIKKWLRNYFSH